MAYTIDRVTFARILGETVTHVRVLDGSKKSDGMAGSLKTVKVTTANGKQYTMVVKLPPPKDNPGMLSFIINCRVMELENEFYGTILKHLGAFLQGHNLDPGQLLPFAKHFGGTDLYLILEDLRPLGYKMADKFVGLNFKQVSLVMSAVSRFHALTYCYIRREGEQLFQANDIRSHMLHFSWTPKGSDPEYSKDTISMHYPMVEILKNHNEALGHKLDQLTPQFLSLFRGIFDKTDKEYFPVICHGDLWMNNILFRAEDTASNSIDDPVELKFIDLQQVHRGNIFEDLVYFFGTSTTPEFRRHHLLQCLEIYYCGFTQMLQDLNCPVPIEFSPGFLIDNYFKNLKTFAIFAGIAISMQLISDKDEGGQQLQEDSSKEVAEPNDKIVIERIDPKDLIPACSDYIELGDFCRDSILGEPRALQRFFDVMEEMNQLGVLD